MSWYDIFKDGAQYGKNIKSPSIYLDECKNILEHKNKGWLVEDDVLEIDGELDTFFTQNIEVPIVSELKKKYKECKENLRKHQEAEKMRCTERNKKQLEKRIEDEVFKLEYEMFSPGEDRPKIEQKVKELKNRLANFENDCKKHGRENGFGDIVIANMNSFINIKRKEMF